MGESANSKLGAHPASQDRVDSGSGAEREDAGTAAEAEGPQSGPKGIAPTSPESPQ